MDGRSALVCFYVQTDSSRKSIIHLHTRTARRAKKAGSEPSSIPPTNPFLPHPLPPSLSRRQPARISRKQSRLADIIQPEEILHDTVQPQPAAAVRAAAPLERLGIMPEAAVVGVQALGAHAGAEVGVAVDALGAGHDFLAAHEEVVRVCEGGVVRGRVGVEGAEGAGVQVDGVEVRFVLVEDDFAEGFFLGGAGGWCQ